MLIGEITAVLEHFAPKSLQESYDNCGLILGSSETECSGITVCVDVTPAVVSEAQKSGHNLIISHHPLIFSGLKNITPSTTQGKAIIEAIKGDIAVYAFHTSLDSAHGGISWRMGELLGLKDMEVLSPIYDKLLTLQVFVPDTHVEYLRNAMFAAGAGNIGDYDMCSYTLSGEGTFRPKQGANPFIGKTGEICREREKLINVVLPVWKRQAVESALWKHHPYEEPAYQFIKTENHIKGIGLGVFGSLAQPLRIDELTSKIRSSFNSPVVRTSRAQNESQIRRLAICSGSGASLIPTAIAAKCDAILTSDVKYHDFVDYSGKITIMDIGHYESENCSKKIICEIISEKFPNFAPSISLADVNPIQYYL